MKMHIQQDCMQIWVHETDISMHMLCYMCVTVTDLWILVVLCYMYTFFFLNALSIVIKCTMLCISSCMCMHNFPAGYWKTKYSTHWKPTKLLILMTAFCVWTIGNYPHALDCPRNRSRYFLRLCISITRVRKKLNLTKDMCLKQIDIKTINSTWSRNSYRQAKR